MKRINVRVAGLTLGIVVLLCLVGSTLLVATGAYNVAATAPHGRVTRWLLNTLQERSVAVRADEVPVPPAFDAGVLRTGFEEYREMCVDCHGAPGIERGILGQGMNPQPPDLAEEASEWTDRQLFWITKNGIKMAGMPAFGVTHSDEELWAIVSFLRRLQELSPDEYAQLAVAAGPETHLNGTDAHVHDDAQPEVPSAAGGAGQPVAAAHIGGHPVSSGLSAAPAAAPAPTHRDAGVTHTDVSTAGAAPTQQHHTDASPGTQPVASGSQLGPEHAAHVNLPAVAITASAPPVSSSSGSTQLGPEHAAHVSPPPAVTSAALADDGTNRLFTLARELVQDSVVQQRIEDVPTLAGAWSDPGVRDVILRQR